MDHKDIFGPQELSVKAMIISFSSKCSLTNGYRFLRERLRGRLMVYAWGSDTMLFLEGNRPAHQPNHSRFGNWLRFVNWMKGHDSQLWPLKLFATTSRASPVKYTKCQKSVDYFTHKTIWGLGPIWGPVPSDYTYVPAFLYCTGNPIHPWWLNAATWFLLL